MSSDRPGTLLALAGRALPGIARVRAQVAPFAAAWQASNADVLYGQLPELDQLGVRPDLVTMLIGANDMLPPGRRPAAVATYAQLLRRLPGGRAVVSALPPRAKESLAINTLIDRAAASGWIRVASMRNPAWRGGGDRLGSVCSCRYLLNF